MRRRLDLAASLIGTPKILFLDEPMTGTIFGDFFRYIASLIVLFAYGTLLGFQVQTSELWFLAGVVLMMGFAFSGMDLGVARPLRADTAERGRDSGSSSCSR